MQSNSMIMASLLSSTKRYQYTECVVGVGYDVGLHTHIHTLYIYIYIYVCVCVCVCGRVVSDSSLSIGTMLGRGRITS